MPNAVSGRPNQQRIVDPGHTCNWSQVPHLLLDDVAAGRLKPTAMVLYVHFKRVGWLLHGEPVAETLRDTQKATGLGLGTILSARRELAATGWVVLDEKPRVATVTLVERWAENCLGHNVQNLNKRLATVQKPDSDVQNLNGLVQKPDEFDRNLNKAENESGRLKTLEDVEDVPEDRGASPRANGSIKSQANTRSARVRELIGAAGVPLDLKSADVAAVENSAARVEEIAAAYVGLFNHEWGNSYQQSRCSVLIAVENLVAYASYKKNGAKKRSDTASPDMEQKFGHLKKPVDAPPEVPADSPFLAYRVAR